MADTSTPQALSEVVVKRIKECVADIEGGSRQIHERAFEIGDILNKEKNTLGHGNFTGWLKEVCAKCNLSVRHAQRYMKLARERPNLMQIMKDKNDTMSDLTLAEAERLLEPNNGKGTKRKGADKPERNPSDAYDNVQEKLIEKLKKLMPDEAEIASDETIKALKKTVSEMKQIAKNATAKAA